MCWEWIKKKWEEVSFKEWGKHCFFFIVFLIYSIGYYVAGMIFISVSLYDMTTRILSIVSAFQAGISIEFYYFFDFFFKILWFIVTFGTNTLTIYTIVLIVNNFFSIVSSFFKKYKEFFSNSSEFSSLRDWFHLSVPFVIIAFIILEFWVVGSIFLSQILFLSPIILVLNTFFKYIYNIYKKNNKVEGMNTNYFLNFSDKKEKKKITEFLEKEKKNSFIFDPFGNSQIDLIVPYISKLDSISEKTKKILGALTIFTVSFCSVFSIIFSNFWTPICLTIYLIVTYPINFKFHILYYITLDNEKDKNEKKLLKFMGISSSFILFPVLFVIIIVLAIIVSVSMAWGWTSPVRPISEGKIYYYHSNLSVKHKDTKSQLCRLSSGPLNIIQISALPSLLYFFPSGRGYKNEPNDIQKRNLKIMLQYLFEEKASQITFDKNSLSPWGIRISIPYLENNQKKNYNVQIYGGSKLVLDWVMTIELFIQKYFTSLIEQLVPLYNTVSKAFLFITSGFELFYFFLTNSIAYSNLFSTLIFEKYQKQTDLMVGQGIGGFYAKSIWKKIPEKPFVFTFESLPTFSTLNLDSSLNLNYSSQIPDVVSIVNIHTNSFYSGHEPDINENFQRIGRKNILKTEEAFTSFCSTVAQCAKTNIYDGLCYIIDPDFNFFVEKYRL